MSTYRALLKTIPSPCGIYVINLQESLRQKVEWILKVPRSALLYFGDPPQIGIKAGLIRGNGCLTAIVLFRPGLDQHSPIICTWMNAYNEQLLGLNAMRLLQTQPTLHIHILDEDLAPARHIVIDNPTQMIFQQAVPLIEHMAPWTTSMFNFAKDEIQSQFPTDTALWNTFEHPSGGCHSYE